jgi:hypothetical protein
MSYRHSGGGRYPGGESNNLDTGFRRYDACRRYSGNGDGRNSVITSRESVTINLTYGTTYLIMVLNIQKILICGIFLIPLCGGLIIQLGVPKFATILIEIFIYLLLIISLISRSGRGIFLPHLWFCFIGMLMMTVCSIILSEIDPTRAIFSLRLLFRFYFFYVALTFLELSDETLKKINLFLAFLLLFQLPVVAIKFHYYGISETTMGAYATSDGSLNATISITVLFYAAAYYLLYRPNLRYILVGIGFIVFAIVGSKRIVFFLYPIQFMAIYYYIYLKGKGATLTKKAGGLIVVLFLGVVLSSSILYFNKSLNPEGKVGGKIDYEYAFDYAHDYNTGEDGYGYTYGRIATTERVFEWLTNSGVEKFFFGFGPGIYTPSLFDSKREKKRFLERKNEFMIGYGMTPVSQIALEYGIVGVLFYTLIVFNLAGMCWKYYKLETDPYWKAFAAGSVGFSFSMLFFYFCYHATAIWGDTLPALYFYAMAVVYTRLKRIDLPVHIKQPLIMTPHQSGVVL